MASLDFAFLAEYAKVEPNATVTAVGAGIRGVGVPSRSGSLLIYIAGGVDRERGEGAATLTIALQAPENQYRLEQLVSMDPAPAEGEFATTVFATGLEVPVVGYGKYLVHLLVNDLEVRSLDLWVNEIPGAPTAGD